MFSSLMPGNFPLTTLSALRRSTWLLISGGLGRSSKSRARISAKAKGIGTRSRRRGEPEGHLEQLIERVHLRAGKFVDPAGGFWKVQHVHDGLRDILHIDGLEAGLAAADER
jgi:hypothetical protein